MARFAEKLNCPAESLVFLSSWHKYSRVGKKTRRKGRSFMDLIMSIAAMSVNMKSAQLQQDVSVAMLKKAMNAQEALGESIVEMMPPAPEPGRLLDVTV